METNKEEYQQILEDFFGKRLEGSRQKNLIDKVVAGRVLAALRFKCLDCVAFQEIEIRTCEIKTCPLWPFRMGKNPFRKKIVRKHPFQGENEDTDNE